MPYAILSHTFVPAMTSICKPAFRIAAIAVCALLITQAQVSGQQGGQDARAPAGASAFFPEKPELILQTGHSQKAEALVFSPDGRYVATGGVDQTIRIWETAAGRELRTLAGHAGAVKALAFSPDGQTLASGGSDGRIRFWAVASGRETASFAAHAQAVTALAFSPDGRTLASGGADFAVRLWEPSGAPRELQHYAGHFGLVLALAFSPDGVTLASAGRDRTIRLWRAAGGSPAMRAPLEHTGEVRSVAFSPDGRTLAAAGSDAKVWLWSLPRVRRARKPVIHSAGVLGVAFSRDGTTLLSCAEDRTIRSFAIGQAGAFAELAAQPDGGAAIEADEKSHRREPPNLVDRSSPTYDEKSHRREPPNLVDRSSPTYDEKSHRREPVDRSSPTYETAVFSPDGAQLAASTGEPAVSLRSVAPGGATRRLEARNNPIYSLARSPDGRWLATGNQDATLTLWDLASGRVSARLAGNAGSITTVAFSPDSRHLAAGSKGGAILLWELATGREVRRWTAHPDGVNSLVFARGGTQIISAGVESAIRIWSAGIPAGKSPQLLAALDGHTKEVRALSASADGSLLASAGADQTVRLWSAGIWSAGIWSAGIWSAGIWSAGIWSAGRDAGRRPLRTLHGHTGAVFAVAVSADGRWVASGGADRSVKVWEAASGREVHSFNGLPGRIDSLVFSPDGRHLAAGDATGAIHIWEPLSGGAVVATRNGHAGGVNALDFGSANPWLISGSEDGSVRFWDPSPSGAQWELAATAVSLQNHADWVVVAPDGLFDGSPAAWNQILWRFGRNTFSTAPVELFFNEFFHPDLLAGILSGARQQRPRAAEDISRRDRRQPRVRLMREDISADGRHLTVTLEVTEAPPDGAHATGGGARDLRLFRNGSLVKCWRGDVLLAAGGGPVRLRHTLPLVAGPNRLTAYAFNRDNVKSADETLTLTGGDQLARPGTLYILAIGVNQYDNPAFNLKFAVADATAFSEEVRRQQARLNRFARTEVVMLLDQQATRANLLAALDRLAGGGQAPAPPALAALQPAQPEDAVIVYFSGHGVADAARFYLIPHDLGYPGPTKVGTLNDTLNDPAGWRQLLASGISDLDLERRFEPVDAGQFVFILDTCQSGQALEAEEKRRGPMNSRGLAQLAYEKGMNILTAAQSYQAAWENAQLGHGYLTYALIVDGLRNLSADNQPRDGQVLLREWLDYAIQQTPRLQQQQEETRRGIRLGTGPKTKPDFQRPRVFYRREADQRALIIARP
jgi:WD40 repeat protein/uncharacterized caspase-like protein